MEYNTKDVEKTFNCRVVGRTSKGDFKLDMDGQERILQVISVMPEQMEFVLDDIIL